MVRLFLLILGGTFVVLVNVSLPHLMGWLQRRSEKGEAARLDWIGSEPLQLQRVAFEARGIGPWKCKDGGVPVTAKLGQRFRGMRFHPSDDTAMQLSELFSPLIGQGKLGKNQRSIV
jgi:hypothetical protein